MSRDSVVIFSKPVNYDISCADTSWMRIEPYINWFTVYFEENAAEESRENTIYLSNDWFPTQTLSVMQAAKVEESDSIQ